VKQKKEGKVLKLMDRRGVLVATLVVAGIGSSWIAIRAKAQTATIEYLAFGVVGIAAGQTARLNAVTVGVQNDVPVELVFFDSDGKVAARTFERLAPGRAVFLDVPYVAGPEGKRMRIRALVRWGSQAAKGGYVIPTFEVVDDVTGRATVLGGNPEG
jgi:hypothetical protein